jgi:hypothetical protein
MDLNIKLGMLVTTLNTVLIIIFYYKESKSLIWIKRTFFFGLVLTLVDLLIFKYLLRPSFPYSNNLLKIFEWLEIRNNHYISSISYLIKFIFIGLFFKSIFKQKKVEYFFVCTVIVLIIFESIMIFHFKSYQNYDSISSTVKNIFILSGSGLLLYRIYKADISNISSYKNTYFWIAFALFITALTELFLEFIFTKLHDSDLIGFYKLYLVRNALQVMFFLLMIVGFLNAKYLKYLPEKY